MVVYAQLLQGQCVRARVGGEEVASSGSGQSVAVQEYINGWMDGWTAERCWLMDTQAVSARAAGGLSARSVGGRGLMGEQQGAMQRRWKGETND